MRKSIWLLFSILMIASLALAGCATPTAAPTAAPVED